MLTRGVFDFIAFQGDDPYYDYTSCPFEIDVDWTAIKPSEIALAYGNIMAFYILISAGAKYDERQYQVVMLQWKSLKFRKNKDLKFKSEEDKEIFQEYVQLLDDLTSKPRTLQSLACNKVRSCIGENLRCKIGSLPLPIPIKESLMLPHLNDLKKPCFESIELGFFDDSDESESNDELDHASISSSSSDDD